jgi:hypothetical protein
VSAAARPWRNRISVFLLDTQRRRVHLDRGRLREALAAALAAQAAQAGAQDERSGSHSAASRSGSLPRTHAQRIGTGGSSVRSARCTAS